MAGGEYFGVALLNPKVRSEPAHPKSIPGRRLLAARLHCKLDLMTDWSQCQAVETQPGKVSGEWVFKGTRVLVRALFENIRGGARIEDFLEWFPGVRRDQVEVVLKFTGA